MWKGSVSTTMSAAPEVRRFLFLERDPTRAERLRETLESRRRPALRIAHSTHLIDALTYLRVSPADLLVIGEPAGEDDAAAATRKVVSTFPELPVRDQWPSEAEQALMDRWIQRMAPRLLCLPYLDDATRARLEPLAREQAVDVDMLWRLYPRLMDNGFVKAARIEARLRTSSARG